MKAGEAARMAEVLAGRAGLAGVQWALLGRPARAALREAIREMLAPGCGTRPLRLTRAKFKPNRRLQGYYTLTVDPPDGGRRRTLPVAVAWTPAGAAAPEDHPPAEEHPAGDEQPVDPALATAQEEAGRRGLLAPFHRLWGGDPDWGLRVEAWPLDGEFAQLPRLGDPVYAPELFAAAGLDLPAGGSELRVTPLRYRPGERHVLRYDLGSAGEATERRLYVKAYKEPAAAARIVRVANRVVDWLAEHTWVAQGVRPAGWSPPDAAVIYPHAAGVPLSRQLHRSRGWLNAQLAKVGATLAVLHAGPPELAADLAENPLEKEAKVIRRAGEHLQALLPETAGCLHGLLDRALALHRRLPQEPPTFTHSDFKCDHLLAGPQSLTLIDFDTCALADPALDLGKFLADLDWWFTLEDAPGVEQAQAAFLHGYGPEPGEGRFARARLYHALILAKISLRRAKLYLPDWAALTDGSVRRADAILRELERA